ncbi:unnamed protein product [Cunninghamella echinulata]
MNKVKTTKNFNWIPDCYGSLRESTESEIKLLNEKQEIGTFQMDTTAEFPKKHMLMMISFFIS